MNHVEIWMIDDNGEMSMQSIYTCSPIEALIAYRMQQQSNWNTWDYPKQMDDIKQTPKGEYVYFTGDNTAIYTRTIKTA